MCQKTRSEKELEHPGLFKLLGAASELPVAELPTLRQCLQYVLLVEDQCLTRLTKRDKIAMVVEKLMGIWEAVNPLLPVSLPKSVIERLLNEYEKARAVTKPGRAQSDDSDYTKFCERLDKLFDICKCRCTIVECNEYVDCDGCEFEAHVLCSCRRANKIPKMEFMSAQRSKVGEKSTMQIGRVDKVESKRQVTSLKRKYSKISSTATATAGCSREAEGSSSDSPNPASQSESEYSSGEGPRTRNFLDVSKVAAAAIRYGISNRATSAVCTATLAAAKDAGWISKAVNIQSVDRHKIDRAKSVIMKDAQKSSKEALQDVTCILFDGRKDDTKVVTKGEDGRYHQRIVREEHYSMCSEPDGQYITHFTIDSKERGRGQSAAQHLGQTMFDWLNDNNMCQNIVAVGGDSTNVNTGWKGGAIQFLEKKMGKR